jgi:hypothetical protein
MGPCVRDELAMASSGIGDSSQRSKGWVRNLDFVMYCCVCQCRLCDDGSKSWGAGCFMVRCPKDRPCTSAELEPRCERSTPANFSRSRQANATHIALPEARPTAIKQHAQRTVKLCSSTIATGVSPNYSSWLLKRPSPICIAQMAQQHTHTMGTRSSAP